MQTQLFAKGSTKATPYIARQLAFPSSYSQLQATTVTPQPTQRNVFRRSVQRSLNKKKIETNFHPRERSPGVITPPKNIYEKMDEIPKLNRHIELEEKAPEPKNPLRFESTISLIKKFFIYKVMASDIFINYSLLGMRLSYKLLGTSLTNYAIE